MTTTANTFGTPGGSGATTVGSLNGFFKIL